MGGKKFAMKEIEINLLHLEQQRKNRQLTKAIRPGGVAPALASFFIIGTCILSATAAFSYQQTKAPDSALNITFNSLLSGAIPHFGATPDRSLTGESDDRVNILLLGVGGDSHDGGQLSDTNIVLSIQPSKRRVAFISIPRDLVVPIEGYGWKKINEVNAWGEREHAGSGPEKAAKVVEKILNISIPYYIRVDFRAFSDIVDTLGGISVNVERSFTDYTYPTADYKYQTISFSQGPTRMNGDRALKFVRSRHSGMNNEGSDFARSKRQQKVIAAMKDAIFSTDTLLNPKKISSLFESLNKNIATNISPWQGIKLLTLARETSEQSIIRLTFDDSPESFLTSDWPAGGAYMLRPKDGTFEGMQRAVTSIFDISDTLSETESIRLEAPTVIVKNGTTIAGLATQYANVLTAKGFSVIGYSNAHEKDRSTSALFLTSSAQKTQSVAVLEALFRQKPTRSGWDDEDLSGVSSRPDFLIVLGADAHTPETSTLQVGSE